MFAERARRADPSFDLVGGAAEMTARLVARLDGMPLAIELEALGLPQLLDRLHLLPGNRRPPARQQSLTATINWSYQLLTQDMRRGSRQPAIFPGPFSLEAVEDVIGVSARPRSRTWSTARCWLGRARTRSDIAAIGVSCSGG